MDDVQKIGGLFELFGCGILAHALQSTISNTAVSTTTEPIDQIMRLKLVIIAAVIATLVGAGASIAIIIGISSSLRPLSSPGLLVGLTLLLPLASCLLATVFVYRHTAKRRRLQATLTALLSIVLTIAAFVIASVLSARYRPLQPPRPVPQPIATIGYTPAGA